MTRIGQLFVVRRPCYRATFTLLGAVLWLSTDLVAQSGTITGVVTTKFGARIVPRARVQVMDPRSKTILVNKEADAAGEYKIPHIPNGLQDIVACDDNLDYEPLIQITDVRPNDNTLNFDLKPRFNEQRPSNSAKNSNAVGAGVVYLKHKKTGCEPSAIPLDEVLEIDSRTLDQYDQCTRGVVQKSFTACIGEKKDKAAETPARQ